MSKILFLLLLPSIALAGNYPEVDLNGDGKPEKISSERKGSTISFVIEDGADKRKNWALKFKLSGHSQESFCGDQVSVETESPSLPLEEWGCEVEMDSKECKDIVALDKQIRDAAKKGMKGLSLSDGQCDPFHIYWDFNKKQFRWWRL
jgi:hypothetical protein